MYQEKFNIQFMQKKNQKNILLRNMSIMIQLFQKIPTSLYDNLKLLNVPENFTLHIDSFRLFTEAKFIVPFTGEIFTITNL